ncbi:MAG: hypothetical protein ACSHYF_04430 [Verrucomicrobiaceae bacterium]
MNALTRLRPLTACLLTSFACGSEVSMTFDSLPLSANPNLNLFANPWTENGMILTCKHPTNASLMEIGTFGQTSTRHVPTIAATSKWSISKFTYAREDGGPFTMKSIKLHPYTPGSGGTVLFTGVKQGGGSAVHATFSTGTNIAGIVQTFPATFDNLESLSWEVGNNQPNKAYHQFDALIAEVPALLSIPEEITLSEGHSGFELPLILSASLPQNSTINYDVSGTAIWPDDYTRSLGVSGAIMIPSGTTRVNPIFNIAADTLDESPETIVITWTFGSGDYFLANNTTIFTIGDTNANSYPDYVAGHGLTNINASAGADPNGDGFSNIEAYVHRFNPAGPSPAGWQDRLPRFTTNILRSGTYPALTYTVPNPLPEDVRFNIYQSKNLQQWNLIGSRTGYRVGSLWTGGTLIQDNANAAGRSITARSADPIEGNPGQTLKVEYTYSPGLSGGGGSTRN